MKKIPCRNCGRETNHTFCSEKCILEYKKALRYASDNPKPKFEYNKIKKLRPKNDKRLLKENQK